VRPAQCRYSITAGACGYQTRAQDTGIGGPGILRCPRGVNHHEEILRGKHCKRICEAFQLELFHWVVFRKEEGKDEVCLVIRLHAQYIVNLSGRQIVFPGQGPDGVCFVA